MPKSSALTALVETVEALKPEFAAMSDAIWEHAELSFHEERSAATQIAMLEKYGFRVSRGLAEIDTAFVGEAGAGGPVIAFLGEFDALAGLSQVAVAWLVLALGQGVIIRAFSADGQAAQLISLFCNWLAASFFFAGGL